MFAPPAEMSFTHGKSAKVDSAPLNTLCMLLAVEGLSESDNFGSLPDLRMRSFLEPNRECAIVKICCFLEAEPTDHASSKDEGVENSSKSLV